MSKDKPTQGSQKVDRRTSIIIIALLSMAIIIQLVTYQIEFEPEELDRKIDNFTFTLNISLFGIVFIIMAKKGMNEYLIRSFGFLFISHS